MNINKKTNKSYDIDTIEFFYFTTCITAAFSFLMFCLCFIRESSPGDIVPTVSLWAGIISAAIAVISFIMAKVMSKRNSELKEDYITRIPSKSGRHWGIARTMVHNGSGAVDSRTFLESHGFIILGLIDEMLYAVEPPEGWKEKHFSEFHSYILDEKGEKKFTHFRKNDIMNPSDYRAHLSDKIT